MSAEQIQALYERLVFWVADTAPGDWRKVHINMEVLASEAEASNSWVIHCVTGEEHVNVEYPASGARKLDMRDLFIELNDAAAESGDRWTVCDFTVSNDGSYTVEYQYGAPPRLSGNLTANT